MVSRPSLKKSILFIFLYISLHVFRYGIGYDYFEYEKIFTSVDFNSHSFIRLEPLNQWLIKIFRSLNLETLLHPIYSIGITFFCYKAYSNQENKLPILFSFIALPTFYLLSMSIIRQFMALSILFYLISRRKDLNIYWIILGVLVSLLFHKGSIIGIIVLLLYCRELKFSSLVSFFLVSILVLKFIETLATYLGVGYIMNSFKVYQGGDLILYLYLSLSAILIAFRKKLDREITKHLIIVLIGLILYFLLKDYGQVGQRVFLYFSFGLPIILVRLFQILFGNRYKLGMAAFMILIFLFTLNVSKKNIRKPFVPYQTIFSIED